MLALRWKLILLVLSVVGGAGILFACSQTPTSVPIRTFERAQRVDTICLRLSGPDAPAPQPVEACAPVPSDINGINLDSQLFALVTQTSRGEVAVVDLSAGQVVDRSKAIPGINFLPVGAIPTDIAATPDGRMAFVASGEPNKYAIYGIPGHRILGDFIDGFTGSPDPEGPITLGSWPVCTLPQRPGSLTVVPRKKTTVTTGDAGASDAGDGDAGAAATADDLAPYELVAVLPGNSVDSAKIITIDPKPFLRASPRKVADGGVEQFGDGDRLVPGQPQPCHITGATELAGSKASVVPDSFTPGNRWDDGVKWVDGGVDLTCAQADRPLRCGGRPCGCPAVIVGPDGGAPLGDTDAGACEADAGGSSSTPIKVDHGPLDAPLPVAIARDNNIVYVADDALPLIHVFDLSAPGNPIELPPFVLSSISDPDRVATVRDLAVSPPTREFKRFLYAVDRKDGTIAAFEVTDLATASRTPMRRPHPELNPFQPEDRLAFGAPVVTVAFARHDVPLTQSGGRTLPASQTGVLCNPNRNLTVSTDPPDYGASYRAGSSDTATTLSPGRLRGIFAFATLASGQIVAIDVDDWDAPCRRPQLLDGTTDVNGVAVSFGALAVQQPLPTSPTDYDPYHAPNAAEGSVTQEAFFPVSAPHRIRSTFYLRNDSVTGNHIPFLVSQPQIQGTGAPLPQSGPGSESTPKLRPTTARPGSAVGTEDVGLRFSIDTPDVHFDQDWTVQYEGQIPGFQGLPAPLTTKDGYNSLILTQEQAKFCAKGVEDWTVGGERANSITNALRASGRATPPEALDRRMMDYVQIIDELLPATDPFWTLPEDPNSDDACFIAEPTPGTRQPITDPGERYNTCNAYFGPVAQQNTTRDYPILEAYDDHLVLGRFGRTAGSTTREAIYSDASNKPFMRLARCCFHKQVNFAIRGGSQWITLGSTLGFMSHMTTDTNNRCVASCDPREALLNSRVPMLPYTPDAAVDFAPHRDTPLALRNPSFSFFIQNGFVFDPTTNRQIDATTTRDTFYHFSTRGQFTPLVIDLSGGTGSTSVNPQSMRFIDSLGQIAVVDGASQGLVLLDLSLVAIARAPYF